MLKAIQSILADKYNEGKLFVVDQFNFSGKTKELAGILESKNLKSSFLVSLDKNSLSLRAVKNLRHSNGSAVEGFSVYESLKYENLIIEKEALDILVTRIGK